LFRHFWCTATTATTAATSGKQKAKKAEAKGKDGAVPDKYPHPAKPPVSNDLSEQDAGNLLNKRLMQPDVSVRSQMPRPDIKARYKGQTRKSATGAGYGILLVRNRQITAFTVGSQRTG
jgi:hypothetical protein